MKRKEALHIISRSLVSYIEDSAGADSDEANEIQEAYDIISKPEVVEAPKDNEIYPMKCSVTGEVMHSGYYIEDEKRHIKNLKDVIAWLRGRNVDEFSELSDEYLIDEAYQLEEIEYVVIVSWEQFDQNNYYDSKGNHCSTFKK